MEQRRNNVSFRKASVGSFRIRPRGCEPFLPTMKCNGSLRGKKVRTPFFGQFSLTPDSPRAGQTVNPGHDPSGPTTENESNVYNNKTTSDKSGNEFPQDGGRGCCRDLQLHPDPLQQ